MKKHDSRLLEDKEIFYEVLKSGEIYNSIKGRNDFIYYVDSNNFLHNLNGYAWEDSLYSYYFIHGKQYSKKQWLIKREELLLEQHRKEILNQI